MAVVNSVFESCIRVMASSSTLPSSGKAMVFLSWVHVFIIYVATKNIDFLRKVLIC